MTPEADATALEATTLAHRFGDYLTRARLKSSPPEQRQADAARAMMLLTMLEETVSRLKPLMPRSTEEGQAMRRDLREIA